MPISAPITSINEEKELIKNAFNFLCPFLNRIKDSAPPSGKF